MSQEERDARLGLTGLSPEQREKRLRELEAQFALEREKAREALDRRRKEAREKRGT